MRGKLLNARQVEGAKPGAARREIPDGGTGLYLVVQPSGAKSWALRYRHAGKPKKMTLGRFPLLGLADAREAAGEAQKKIGRGVDPAAARAVARQRQPDTVRSVGAEFVRLYAKAPRPGQSGPRLRTWREVERTLELHVYPEIGARDIATITRRDILDVLDRAAEGGATTRCNRILAHLRKMLAWAVQRDIIAESPAAGIESPSPEAARDRVLTDDELRAFLRACDRMDQAPKRDPKAKRRKPLSTALPARFGALFKMLAYTASRREEVAGAPWAEIDVDRALWTLPGDRTKNGRGHDLPLADTVLAILETLPSKGRADLLFPSRGAPGRAASGFGRAKERLDALMLEELRKAAAERGADPDQVKLAPWRLHDLRRSAASGMAGLGVGIHVVERLLNHVSGSTTGGIVAVYQKHDFAEAKRKAMAAWAGHLDGLVAVRPSNVVSIRETTA